MRRINSKTGTYLKLVSVRECTQSMMLHSLVNNVKYYPSFKWRLELNPKPDHNKLKKKTKQKTSQKIYYTVWNCLKLILKKNVVICFDFVYVQKLDSILYTTLGCYTLLCTFLHIIEKTLILNMYQLHSVFPTNSFFFFFFFFFYIHMMHCLSLILTSIFFHLWILVLSKLSWVISPTSRNGMYQKQ